MCRCLKREIQSKFLQTSILPLKFKVNFITFDAIFYEIWLHIPNNSNTCQIRSLLETPILKASVDRNFEFLQTRLTYVSVGIIHRCLLKILCKFDLQIWSHHRIFVIVHLAKFSTWSIQYKLSMSLRLDCGSAGTAFGQQNIASSNQPKQRSQRLNSSRSPHAPTHIEQ